MIASATDQGEGIAHTISSALGDICVDGWWGLASGEHSLMTNNKCNSCQWDNSLSLLLLPLLQALLCCTDKLITVHCNKMSVLDVCAQTRMMSHQFR